jgi:hypothetical protein
MLSAIPTSIILIFLAYIQHLDIFVSWITSGSTNSRVRMAAPMNCFSFAGMRAVLLVYDYFSCLFFELNKASTFFGKQN